MAGHARNRYRDVRFAMDPAVMSILEFDKYSATPLAREPFAHVVVPGFVAAAALPEVCAALPAMRDRGSFPVQAVRLGPAAMGLVTALEGPEFRAITSRKFGLDLSQAPAMTTLRGYSSESDGRIHTDSVAKRMTVLLYLNAGASDAWSDRNGCLRLLRGGSDLEDYAVEVPPVDGTLLVFANGPEAWHGHKPYVGPRYVVQMNYMKNGVRARTELGRHHLSAFVKRLRRAA